MAVPAIKPDGIGQSLATPAAAKRTVFQMCDRQRKICKRQCKTGRRKAGILLSCVQLCETDFDWCMICGTGKPC